MIEKGLEQDEVFLDSPSFSRCTLLFERDRFSNEALQSEWWNNLKFLDHCNKNEAIP